MAVAVKSLSAQLDFISRSYGRRKLTDLDKDTPNLVDEACQLLKIDEAKASSVRNEHLQAVRMYTTSCKLTDLDQKSQTCNEEPQTTTPEWSCKGKNQYMAHMPQLNSSAHNSESPYTTQCTLSQPQGKVFGESTEKCLHRSTCQLRDNKDFSGIQSSFSSFTSTPKSFLNKTVHRSQTPAPGYSKSCLSGTLREDCSLGQERPRSRSLSLARIFSSDTLKPLFDDSLADVIEDKFSRAWKSRQQSFGNAIAKKQAWQDSHFQADYWACALPNCKPPSPDRQSPHWNPDKDYEDLLDYTYPLNSKHLRSMGKSSDYVSSDPLLYDSGIGLSSSSASSDHTVLSPSSSWNDAPHSNIIGSGKFALSTQQAYTNSSSTAGYLADYNLHPAPAGTVSPEKCSGSTSGIDVYTDFKIPFYNCALSSSSTASSVDDSEWCNILGHDSLSKLQRDPCFIPTTEVLQLKKVWDNDDEYLSLPPRVKELENLAQQLTDLSFTVQKSGYDNKERDLLASIDSSADLKQKYIEMFDVKEIDSISKNDRADSSKYRFTLGEQENTNKKMTEYQGGAESGLTKLTTLKYMLEGISAFTTSTTDGWHQDKEKVTENGSLVQCVKMFCHKLEDLIQWLYKAADMSEKWVPPKPDVGSIKSALQFYLKFKKDVVEHQTVADDVIKMGEILLKCMASNSPVLSDTLALIVKHSEELERRGEGLYASVLGAMDTIISSGDH